MSPAHLRYLLFTSQFLTSDLPCFILDSLMISGLKWVMNTVVTAAEAEMNDDTALREQLLEAEMRREMGEISDEEFEDLEADLLGAYPRDQGTARGRFGAAVDGRRSRSRRPPTARSRSKPASRAISTSPPMRRTPPSSKPGPDSGEQIAVIDMEPGPADRRLSSRPGSGASRREANEAHGGNDPSEPNGPNGPNDPNLSNDPNDLIVSSLTYVYCLVRSARRPSLRGVPAGMPGGQDVRILEIPRHHAGVRGGDDWLVVSTVPERGYGEAALEQGLQQLEWVAPRALAHEAVVEHFLPAPAVLPMQLFTMFTERRARRRARGRATGGASPRFSSASSARLNGGCACRGIPTRRSRRTPGVDPQPQIGGGLPRAQTGTARPARSHG